MEIIIAIITLIIILALCISIIIIVNRSSYNMLLVKIDESIKNIEFFINNKEELLIKSVDIIKNSNKKKYNKKDILDQLIKDQNIKVDLYEKDKNLKKYLRELHDIIENDNKLSDIKEVNDILLELKDCENDLNASKKYYNKVINDIDKSFKKFPKNILKGILKYKKIEKFNTKKEEIFEILKDEKKA